MPETWLNGGRWEDAPSNATALAAFVEPEPVNGSAWGWWRGKEASYRGLKVETWRKAIAEAKPNGTWPWWILGPPPGHPECLLPAEVITENGFDEIYQGNRTI